MPPLVSETYKALPTPPFLLAAKRAKVGAGRGGKSNAVGSSLCAIYLMPPSGSNMGRRWRRGGGEGKRVAWMDTKGQALWQRRAHPKATRLGFKSHESSGNAKGLSCLL